MKLNTRLINIPNKRTTITAFGGLNRTTAPAEGGNSRLCELTAMQNMTSDGYPAAQSREKRYNYSLYKGEYAADYRTIEGIYNGGLFTLYRRGDGTGTLWDCRAAYCGFHFLDWDLTEEEYTYRHQLVNMAAYIVIFPEGVWFDTVKAKEYIENYDEESGESTVPFSNVAGRIEIERKKPSGETADPYANVLMRPCGDDGTPAATYPSDKFLFRYQAMMTLHGDDGMYAQYNADNSSIGVYFYQEDNATLQTDYVFRFEDFGTEGSDFSAGFFAGDEITVEDLQITKDSHTYDLDFGGYAYVLDVGGDYITLRFSDINMTSLADVFSNVSRGSGNTPFFNITKFTIRRPLPDIKYVTEWNNRIWGCGGENNSVIYASALGNPRSWSVFENTAADSYFMNVGDGEEWTGAATFDDHAYLFKQNKMWKIFGSRPSNFQSSTLDFGTISDKSVCTVGTTLFWAARDGVFAYGGGLPQKISYKLGDEGFYGDCVGWGCEGKFYLCCARKPSPEPEDYTIYVYDLETGLWHGETVPAAGMFAACALPEEVLICTRNGVIGLTGAGIPVPERDPFDRETRVDWSFDTPEFMSYDPDFKWISKIQISCEIGDGASASVSVFYDGREICDVIGNFAAGHRRTELLPIRLRRCQRAKLHIEGIGFIKIYSISYYVEGGSEYGKRKI